MAINKVVYGNDTLIDLTEDTATADDVLNGKTFHLKNGLRATGNASIGDGSLIIKENATTVETFNANQTTDTTLTLGNLAFYNGDTLASGVDPVSIGIDMDLLWTNATPTASFSAQTISLDLSGYTMVMISVFIANSTALASSNSPKVNLFGRIGDTIGMEPAPYNSTFRRRDATIFASGVSFSDGRYYNSYNDGNNGAVQNVQVIPYQIYGIK